MTYIEKLKTKIDLIIKITDEMLDNSSIHYHDPNRNTDSGIIVFAMSRYRWGNTDPKSQLTVKKVYNEFHESFKLLLTHSNQRNRIEMQKTHKSVIDLIEQKKAPTSIENGKQRIRNHMKKYVDFLHVFELDSNTVTVIPDTNSIIQYPDPISYKSIANSDTFEFVILPTILSELDKHKMNHRNEDFRKKVTSVIKRLKGFRKQGDILKGVTVSKSITVRMVAIEPDFTNTLSWIDENNNDDRIIANILNLQTINPSNLIYFVTSDINLQNKAELANLTVFDTDEMK